MSSRTTLERSFRTLLERLSPNPRLDRSLVGISFVDILFALVVGQILEPLAAWDQLRLEAIFHIGVAFVLTVGSWIGYHNSLNRPHYSIGFINLPLWQFLVDVLLVIVYWLTASYVDGAHSYGALRVNRSPSAIPETTFVAFSFLLYVLWDWIARTMRFNEKYKLFRKDRDKPKRRTVTKGCLAVSAVVATYAWSTRPSGRLQIVILDILLMALLILYRILKETVGGRSSVDREASLEAEFDYVLDSVGRIRKGLQERGHFPA